MEFITKLLIFTLFVTVCGCVSGKKRENDSVLSYLNGDNYSVTSSVGGVPIGVSRKKATVRIWGRLVVDLIPLPEPLKYQHLVLTQGTQEVLRTLTDSEGKFEFASAIPNGRYQIQLQSERYSAIQEIKIESYELGDLQVLAKPLNAKSPLETRGE